MKKLKALLTVAVLIALIFTAVSCGKTASSTYGKACGSAKTSTAKTGGEKITN